MRFIKNARVICHRAVVNIVVIGEFILENITRARRIVAQRRCRLSCTPGSKFAVRVFPWYTKRSKARFGELLPGLFRKDITLNCSSTDQPKSLITPNGQSECLNDIP